MPGFYTLLVPSKRVRKMAVITKPSTLLRLHQALVRCNIIFYMAPNEPVALSPKSLSELFAAVGRDETTQPAYGLP